MIDVEHISKNFGRISAVRDISFRVNSGEILGFLGPNGAGKTTTMRVLTGFYPPSSGTARVAGSDVFENSLAVRKKIGYLPENVPLYGDMIVEEYLRFVAEVKGVGRGKRLQSVGSAIDSCQLRSVEKRYIKKLSKGYRQRVGLAQALIGDPEVLILDEPTIGLDPKQINEIRNVIKSFAGQKTVILSTHILPEVSMTCQRVVIVNQGRVVAEDTPQNLSAQLSGANRIKMKIGGPVEEVVKTLQGCIGVTTVSPDDSDYLIVESSTDLRPQLAKTICAAGWDLYEMTPLTASLEDVFLKLVTKEEHKEEQEAANHE
ncbi:MAG: ATP-binding cassette domain-containing protein [Deltaproteobacteria bacterium]|nr:ATP-binding cassette domain-containing protein [Deltaproteobacteria bacterium]